MISNFLEFKSLHMAKTAQCHPSFFKKNFRNLDSKKARKIGLLRACHTFSHDIMAGAVRLELTARGFGAEPDVFQDVSARSD